MKNKKYQIKLLEAILKELKLNNSILENIDYEIYKSEKDELKDIKRYIKSSISSSREYNDINEIINERNRHAKKRWRDTKLWKTKYF